MSTTGDARNKLPFTSYEPTEFGDSSLDLLGESFNLAGLKATSSKGIRDLLSRQLRKQLPDPLHMVARHVFREVCEPCSLNVERECQ
jgi:hypothetical protein